MRPNALVLLLLPACSLSTSPSTGKRIPIYVNAGTGNSGAGTWLGANHAHYSAMGYSGIRTDIHWDPETYRAVVHEFDNSPLCPIYIVHGRGRASITGEVRKLLPLIAGQEGYLEISNEPNYDEYWRLHPAELGLAVADAVAMAPAGFQVISGGVGTTNADGQAFIHRMELGPGAWIGYHSYNRARNEPLPPWTSRSSELDSINRTGLPYAMTESDNPRVCEEYAIQAELGARFYVVYNADDTRKVEDLARCAK